MPRDFNKQRILLHMLRQSLPPFPSAALTSPHPIPPFPFLSSTVLSCLLSLPSPHPPPSLCPHPLIQSHIIPALCATLCDPAPAVRFLAVSAVQHLITVAGINIDDAPQLLPPLCMNRFHHADGVKASAQVGVRARSCCRWR
jgi:hypothetical protein